MALYTSILTGGSNTHTTTSEEANYVATDFVSAGVVGSLTNTNGVAPATGAFAVNAQGTPDMTVAVTAGSLYMAATPSGQGSQKFRVRLSANENVTISANSSGSTKYDWVYSKIDPTTAANPNLAGDDVASLVVSRSSSSTTDNGTPPTYGYNIAVVTVANGATTITNANITDKRAQSQIAATDTAVTTGWITNALPAVSLVTNNGNGSEDIGFASSVDSILSPGMRLRTTRTVAAPTYMGGALNGSSHYFTKASPSGTLGTITNNFSLKATVQPTSYAQGYIGGRFDSTPNNGLGMKMEADGRVTVVIINGGTANFRSVSTYRSLPLNKTTKVWATYASGTVLVYFDGISVPVATAVTGGTAPTTAGTGGDFSIGRPGAYNTQYFPGYISDFGVFDAVISASTIKALDTQALTGSETNCIGAWSLNNTANDQNAAANHLTATGGVGYTNISPYGSNGASTTLDYALVMAVSGSTATVQTPNGCTIPTTGGVSAVAYAPTGTPYGWPVDEARWEVSSIVAYNLALGVGALSTNYDSNIRLTAPVGAWVPTLSLFGTVNSTVSTSSQNDGYFFVAETASAAAAIRGLYLRGATNSATNYSAYVSGSRSSNILITTATSYSIWYNQPAFTGGAASMSLRGDLTVGGIFMIPAGL